LRLQEFSVLILNLNFTSNHHLLMQTPTNGTPKTHRGLVPSLPTRWSQRILSAWAVGGLSLSLATAGVDLTEAQLSERLSHADSSLSLTVNAIETSVTAGNPKLLSSLIDTAAVLETATAGMGGNDTETVRKIFCDGTKQAWTNNSPANDYAGTLFRFLRVRSFQNRAGLLFRSENDTGNINYFLLVMSEQNAGEYRVRDIYTFGLNEFASEGLRRTYSHLLASFASADEAKKYSPIGQIYVDHLQDIANLNRCVRDGKYADALSLYHALPKEIQKERSVMMMRIDAAERISPQDRALAMQDWMKNNPNEMSLPLKIADFYMSQNRWSEAQVLLGKVIQNVGGDSRMLFQLGQVAYNSHRDGNNWVESAKLGNEKEAASAAPTK
jgi:hypothetical protein